MKDMTVAEAINAGRTEDRKNELRRFVALNWHSQPGNNTELEALEREAQAKVLEDIASELKGSAWRIRQISTPDELARFYDGYF